MPALTTEAIVLHSFDYLESSRIYRLATREAGLQSVLARGARSSRQRFGPALGLFSTGTAQMTLKEGRDLHTLNSFEVTDVRRPLADDYLRFLGASVIAELLLRFSSTETSGELYDVLSAALDEIEGAAPGQTRSTTLALAWRIVAELGFGPSLAGCANCHALVPEGVDATFSHRVGGVLCDSCARGQHGGGTRRLPARARQTLAVWLAEHGGETSEVSDGVKLEGAEERAHTRLLREFVAEHLADERPLKAFELWEKAP